MAKSSRAFYYLLPTTTTIETCHLSLLKDLSAYHFFVNKKKGHTKSDKRVTFHDGKPRTEWEVTGKMMPEKSKG